VSFRSGRRDRTMIVLDCLGQRCPLPVIKLAQRIRDVGIGEVVRVLADDPAAANDIPAWCRMKGHEFVAGDGNRFDVRRLS
jgi:tRNA 2-thiouridine synthesizing protein A